MCGEERERFVVPLIYDSFVDSICSLTRDQTHNLGVLGQQSNQLSYPARASPHVLKGYTFSSDCLFYHD